MGRVVGTITKECAVTGGGDVGYVLAGKGCAVLDGEEPG